AGAGRGEESAGGPGRPPTRSASPHDPDAQPGRAVVSNSLLHRRRRRHLGRHRPDRLPVPQGLGRSRLTSAGSFLEATIESQPDVLERLPHDPPSASAVARLSGRSRIFIVGTGTSYPGDIGGPSLL